MHHILYKNIKASYTDSGQGDAIVLLHGFLENKLMWQNLSKDYVGHYRVISIDLLGHGDTECLGYIHTMESNAEMVNAVIEQLQIPEAIFVGHSMGGYVALAFAEAFPKKVAGLVLLNSTSKADSSDRKANRDRAIKAVKANYSAFIQLSIVNLFTEENRERLVLEIEKTKQEALKTPLQGIVASLEGMKIRKDRENLLAETSYPKMFILGEKDPVLPFDIASQQTYYNNTRLVCLFGGHMSHLENFDELKNELNAFFATIVKTHS